MSASESLCKTCLLKEQIRRLEAVAEAARDVAIVLTLAGVKDAHLDILRAELKGVGEDGQE